MEALKGQEPRLFLRLPYIDAVVKAGGIPVLLPHVEKISAIEDMLDQVDCLLLTGGKDLDPLSYGAGKHPKTDLAHARRLRFDLALAKAALKRKIPILGICMGMQTLNVAAGGTLLQHIKTRKGGIRHQQFDKAYHPVHKVNIAGETRLARIMGCGSLGVNSTHHQAVGEIAPGFRISATAPDGTIEAIERKGTPLVLGVQWHPERLFNDKRHVRIFEALINPISNAVRHGQIRLRWKS